MRACIQVQWDFFFQNGWILVGTVTLIQDYKGRKAPYLILENETLLTQYLFGYKKNRISEFNEIEKKNNSLILKSEKKEKESLDLACGKTYT